MQVAASACRAWLGALLLAALAVAPGLAAAGPVRATGGATHEGELKGRLGVPLARRLLESDDPHERLRGIVRLGAIGTPEAIDALVELVEQGAAIARDPRARLLAVRAVAPHASRDGARQLLLREALEASGSEARGALSPLAGVVRATAALALARYGDKKALVGLASAVLQGGAPAEAATNALRAYPPASLEPLLEGRHRLTPQLAAFVAELGDVRAIGRLRAVIAEPDVMARATAAVALAKLGDSTALPLARGWLKTSDPRLRRSAAEILAALGAPEAGAAIASLVANDATRDAGFALAISTPSPQAGAALAAAFANVPDDARGAVIATMGRSGPALVPTLVKLLGREDTAVAAAMALARAPGDEARRALEVSLSAAAPGAARRRIVRAALVRALELGDAPAGLGGALEALAAARAPEDASVGVFGLVATGSWSPSRAVDGACGGSGGAPTRPCSLEWIGAAARGALARDGADLAAFAPLLDRLAQASSTWVDRVAVGSSTLVDSSADVGRDPRLVAAAGVALLAPSGARGVSTTLLATWAEASGPLAPLAARALAERDAPTLRGRIKGLLEGGDPVVRAHVALGLAKGAEPDGVALLASAYRFEDDAGVRRAIVRGLSGRAEVQRTATLELARDLDPDAGVRGLARAALAGHVLEPPPVPARGGAALGVAWIVGSSTETRPGKSTLLAGRLVRADGLAVPFVTDADGSALLPGFASGPADVQMAPPLRERDGSSPARPR